MLGSSPRVWGQGALRAVGYCRIGIIPTRVGTSIVSDILSLLIWDHPHACGDKGSSADTSFFIVGSSPRVWGQDDVANQVLQWVRIIPTRVGTSKSFLIPKLRTWDHPHACGDKSVLVNFLLFMRGSSPRVWGQGTRTERRVPSARIIPTRVGTRKD